MKHALKTVTGNQCNISSTKASKDAVPHSAYPALARRRLPLLMREAGARNV